MSEGRSSLALKDRSTFNLYQTLLSLSGIGKGKTSKVTLIIIDKYSFS